MLACRIEAQSGAVLVHAPQAVLWLVKAEVPDAK